MKKLIAAIALIALCFNSKAQLYFKNESSTPVKVAYAMKNNGKNNKAWYSEGWYSCDPNERIMLTSAVGLHKYVYYYAFATDGSGAWHGKNRDGAKKFLVSSNAFDIKNADLEYVMDGNSEYRWETFRRIEIGPFQTKRTITLTD